MTANIIPFPQKSESNRVGLLAGAGRFPIVFAQMAREQGYSVHCMGVLGLVDEELRDLCTDFKTAPLARLGKAIRFFRQRGVDRVVMAGKIEKRILFDPYRVFRLLPDWRTVHMWFKYAAENKKDDTLLLAVIREFARDNITFESALDFCPELL
ncbi:MAG: LpxI family protein, partial [Planctomycetaceae bacterium]|nr:LpxI family protein [Planctomycetaceae bacterium]